MSATEISACFDEAIDEEGRPRPHYEALLAELEGRDVRALADSVRDRLRDAGATFGADGGPFLVDPVPRVIPSAEWEELVPALAQRVRALDRFVADVYGRAEIVRAGVVPRETIRAAAYHEPALDGLAQAGRWVAVAGLDVVRCGDGTYRVLEDNLRTPSGIAYALSARAAVAECLGLLHPRPRDLQEGLGMLARALHAAAPEGCEEPVVVVLTDGPASSAYDEHRELARRLGLPLLTLDDLEHRGGRVVARVHGQVIPVDVVYRRTDEDRLSDDRRRPTRVAEALLEPWRRGRLGLVNAFGAGVGDDKFVHAYVEEMVRFYLGEEPLIRGVRTYDLTRPDMLEEVLDRLPELVVKPRDGHGGIGVVIGPHASPAALEAAARDVRSDPAGYIAQETVQLSRHPTVCGERLEPRHIDLRPFVCLTRDDAEVLPGGLTRVAFGRGDLVVNSSQDGGAKDTWVLP